MENNSFVTQKECAEYRQDFEDKLSNHNLRITVVETNMHTISVLSKLILGAVLSSTGAILVTLILK
jgi:hypothetical protein